jgi:hypothetical protein
LPHAPSFAFLYVLIPAGPGSVRLIGRIYSSGMAVRAKIWCGVVRRASCSVVLCGMVVYCAIFCKASTYRYTAPWIFAAPLPSFTAGVIVMALHYRLPKLVVNETVGALLLSTLLSGPLMYAIGCMLCVLCVLCMLCVLCVLCMLCVLCVVPV